MGLCARGWAVLLLVPPAPSPVAHGEPSSVAFRSTKRVRCTVFDWLYFNEAAIPGAISRSTPTETEVVRGFRKFLSVTNTSGWSGTALIWEAGMRFGYAGGSGPPKFPKKLHR